MVFQSLALLGIASGKPVSCFVPWRSLTIQWLCKIATCVFQQTDLRHHKSLCLGQGHPKPWLPQPSASQWLGTLHLHPYLAFLLNTKPYRPMENIIQINTLQTDHSKFILFPPNPILISIVTIKLNSAIIHSGTQARNLEPSCLLLFPSIQSHSVGNGLS